MPLPPTNATTALAGRPQSGHSGEMQREVGAAAVEWPVGEARQAGTHEHHLMSGRVSANRAA